VLDGKLADVSRCAVTLWGMQQCNLLVSAFMDRWGCTHVIGNAARLARLGSSGCNMGPACVQLTFERHSMGERVSMLVAVAALAS
jgi:hypothetical protein